MVTVLWEIAAAIIAGLALWGVLISIFDPKGLPKVRNLIANWVGGALGATGALLKDFEGVLLPIVNTFLKAFNDFGGPIRDAVTVPAGIVAGEAFTRKVESLTKHGLSTPDNAAAAATAAMSDAFGFGIASAVVTGAFEAVFPEKLNTFNAAGPILAHMAGFKEVAEKVLDPLYEAAFGKSLQYHYRALFKPELPSEKDAVEWHARRLLDDKALRKVFGFSGLKDEYETPFVASAYRPISPFIMSGIADDTTFDEAAAAEAARFIGYRESDVQLLLRALREKSVKALKQQVLGAVLANIEAGIESESEIDGVLTFLGRTTDAPTLLIDVAREKRLLKMTLDYKAGWDKAVDAGEITPAAYENALIALGFIDPMLSALAARAQMTVAAKGFVQAEKAAERLQHERQRVALQDAMLGYKNGDLNAVGLLAALLLAGIDAALAALYVQLAVERGVKKAGAKGTRGTRLVYGLELPVREAQLLAEKVVALKEQVLKKLVALADAAKTLKSLQIPDANAKALLAEWAAQALKVKLPL